VQRRVLDHWEGGRTKTKKHLTQSLRRGKRKRKGEIVSAKGDGFTRKSSTQLNIKKLAVTSDSRRGSGFKALHHIKNAGLILQNNVSNQPQSSS